MRQNNSGFYNQWAHYWHRYSFLPERAKLLRILKEEMIKDAVCLLKCGQPESAGRPATSFEIKALHLPKSSYVRLTWCGGNLTYMYLAEKNPDSEVIAVIERLDDLSFLEPVICGDGP